MPISIRTAALVSLLAGAVGCVTAGTHEAMVAERDGLSERANTLAAEKGQLEGLVADLEVSLESANSSFAEQLSEAESKASSLTGTFKALLTDLESEVASGKLEIQRVRDGIQVNLANDILFPSGSARLDDQGRGVLAKVARHLVDAPNAIRVEGHTDNVPISSTLTSRFPSNWELAGARAASVVRLLEDQGIAGSRMRAISSGQFAPRALNISDAGRAKNRRIEIRLLPLPVEGKEIAKQEKAESGTPSSENPAAPADS